ncbi:MAG: redoxin family protein [Candidatus Caldarchaeales archaeon]
MVEQEKHRCKVCGKTFRSESGLRTHMRVDHAGRYYSIRIGIPLILVIIGIIFFSIFASPLTENMQSSLTTPSKSSTDTTGTLKKAPEFTLTAYSPPDLGKVSLSDFEGKPVFLEFFSPTCYYCLRMIPTIEKLSERYVDKMVFIIISVPDRDNLDKVVEEYGLRQKILLDYSNLTVFRDYGVTGTPTFFILDRDHNIVKRLEGARSEDILISAIEEVV